MVLRGWVSATAAAHRPTIAALLGSCRGAARQPQRLARFTAAISSRAAHSCPYAVDVFAEATRSNRASQSHSGRMLQPGFCGYHWLDGAIYAARAVVLLA